MIQSSPAPPSFLSSSAIFFSLRLNHPLAPRARAVYWIASASAQARQALRGQSVADSGAGQSLDRSSTPRYRPTSSQISRASSHTIEEKSPIHRPDPYSVNQDA